MKKALILILVLQAVYAAGFIAVNSRVLEGERYYALFDDAMISMQYAKNWIHGSGLVWNTAGPRVEGITNPLWTVLMALTHWIPLSPSKASLPMMILGAFLLMATTWACWRLAEFLSGGEAAVAGGAALLTAFYFPLLTWGLLGMEVSLLAWVLTTAVWQVLRRIREGASLFPVYLGMGLVTGVRMDFAVPFMVLVIFAAWTRRERIWTELGQGMTVGILCLGAQTGWRMGYYGDLLPNTYYLKMTGVPLMDRVANGAVHFYHSAWNILLPVTMLLAFFQRDRRGALLWLLFAGQACYSIWVGGDAWEPFISCNRFLAVVMPLYFILITAGLNDLLGRWGTPGRSGSRAAGLIALVAVCLLAVNITRTNTAGEWLLTEDHGMLDWPVLDTVLRLRASTDEGAVLAVTTGGVMAYFSGRTCADLLGKNDRFIARLPMRRGGAGTPWYRDLFIGHNKWDVAYVRDHYRPDVFQAAYDQMLPEMDRELDAQYVRVDFIGQHPYASVLLKRSSPHIRWDRLAAVGGRRVQPRPR